MEIGNETNVINRLANEILAGENSFGKLLLELDDFPELAPIAQMCGRKAQTISQIEVLCGGAGNVPDGGGALCNQLVWGFVSEHKDKIHLELGMRCARLLCSGKYSYGAESELVPLMVTLLQNMSD